MREILVRKRALDQDFVCTTFFVPEPNYRFTLEGCNEYAEGIIRNVKGDLVAVLKPSESVDIARRGEYTICIEGRNALGTIWVEWVVPPSATSHEDCCDELRATDNALRTEIDNVRRLANDVGNLTITAGANVTVTKEGYNFNISAVDTVPDVNKAYVDQKIANLEDKDTITTIIAGDNVSVTKNGNDYTINAVDTKPDVDKAYVDQQIANIEDHDTIITITAGANIELTKSGNNYTISASDTKPDVTKAYVDEQIANIIDYDTITTVSAGNNVTVTKNGNDYQISAIDTIPDVDKAYVDSKIAAIQDKDTITTVSGGNNVTVTKNENDYQVNAKIELLNDFALTIQMGYLSPGTVVQKGTTIEELLRMAFATDPYERVEWIHIKESSSSNMPFYDTNIEFAPGNQDIFAKICVESGKMGAPISATDSSTTVRGSVNLYASSNMFHFYWADKFFRDLISSDIVVTEPMEFSVIHNGVNAVDVSLKNIGNPSYSMIINYDSQYSNYYSSFTWKVFRYLKNADVKYGAISNFTITDNENNYQFNFSFYRRKIDNIIVMYDEFNDRYLEPIGDASLIEEYTFN